MMSVTSSKVTSNSPPQKRIALTFDDGPNEPYTTQIAQYLADQGLQATFFMTGTAIKRFPEAAKKVLALGHEIGNHATHHQLRYYLFQPSFTAEIETCNDILEKTIGIRPTLFRPPWLWRTPWLKKTVNKQHMRLVLGRFSNGIEALQPSASFIVRTTMRKVRPGAIIIFHDGYNGQVARRDQTVEAVKQVVERLQQENYAPVTVSQLLDSSPIN